MDSWSLQKTKRRLETLNSRWGRFFLMKIAIQSAVVAQGNPATGDER